MDMSKVYTYDIETYPNVFTCVIKHFTSGHFYIYEWSYRRNDIVHFVNFLHALSAAKAIMVGFNNIGFDYPVIHKIATEHEALNVNDCFLFANKLIKAKFLI